MNSSSEHSFVLAGAFGCAAETEVVPVSDGTTRAAKIRYIITPSEMVPENVPELRSRYAGHKPNRPSALQMFSVDSFELRAADDGE